MASEVSSINCDNVTKSSDEKDKTSQDAKHVFVSDQIPHPVWLRDSESLRFLHSLSSRDPVQRNLALDGVMRTFDGWIEGYGSPKEPVSEFQCEDGTNGLSTDMKHLIREHLPDLLRLSVTCPFPDTRDRCASILKDLQVMYHIRQH